MVKPWIRTTIVILLCGVWMPVTAESVKQKSPLIVITDLYHPYQDPGDNMDLMMGFALPDIDLKAIILDITDAFRKEVADHPTLWKDPRGPREAGVIPVAQLNYLFGRSVPAAVGPLSLMESETDRMQECGSGQGVELFLNTLKSSKKPVTVLSFGSARVLAVAYNRDPKLLHAKIKKIHLCAGTASANFALGNDAGANAIPGGEWNVALDLHAFNRILTSDLPVAIYPCAGIDGAFVKDVNNTYWQLPDMNFTKKMDVRLQRYLDYAFMQRMSNSCLRALDEDLFERNPAKYPSPFHVWEADVWICASGRKVIQQTSGAYRIVQENQIRTDDRIVEAELKPCTLVTREDGRFTFAYTDQPTHFSIFYRPDPTQRELALQEAIPELFLSFQTPRSH